MYFARKTKQPNLIFLHIPKAAGTTLNFILENHYSRANSYSTSKSNYYPDGSIDTFKVMSAAQHANIRWLTGHMGYGYHTYLSAPSVYVTLLREPVDRVISHYYFESSLQESPVYELIQSGKMDLREYLRYYHGVEMDNLQTRMVAGNWEKRGTGPCTPEMLAQAKQNLCDHFAVVGVSHQFDAFYFLLRKYFGWRYVPYLKQNRTQNRPQREAIAESDQTMIREYNKYDLALYQFGEELFARQLQAYALWVVQADLAAASWRNRLYKAMKGHSLREFVREYSVRTFIRQRLPWTS
jgi:hypothetical protein